MIHRVKTRFQRPTAAYQVSGEYAMAKAAARLGWLDERQVMLETLGAIHRAGADVLVTYYARAAARALAGRETQRPVGRTAAVPGGNRRGFIRRPRS